MLGYLVIRHELRCAELSAHKQLAVILLDRLDAGAHLHQLVVGKAWHGWFNLLILFHILLVDKIVVKPPGLRRLQFDNLS